MKKTSLQYKLGQSKTLFNRLMSYAGIISLLMVLKVFAEDEPAGYNWFMWLIIIGIASIIIIILDINLVFSNEQEYSFSKVPQIKQILKNQKQILKLLKEKK